MAQKKIANDVLHGKGMLWINLIIGAVISLATLFVCFELTWYDEKPVEEDGEILEVYLPAEEEMIPITRQEQQQAPPPPSVAPKVETIIEVVEDDVELEKEEFDTSEELNQSLTATRGDHGTVAVAPSAPPAPVEDVDDVQIFDVVEEMPEFPGGDAACMAFINKNLKYPTSCVENGIQGRVMVSFVVNTDGSIVDIKVNRSPDQALSKEAERVLKLMPKWKPGKQRGKPVRCRFNLPVTFRLT